MLRQLFFYFILRVYDMDRWENDNILLINGADIVIGIDAVLSKLVGPVGQSDIFEMSNKKC